jgi:hypothetical protein
MYDCQRCGGSGYEYYEEDGRNIRDACYHCGMTGKVSSDTDFNDRLHGVANVLAYLYVSEYKKARDNSDEYEEPFYFCAAENGMSENEYFRSLVWDYEFEYAKKLNEMSSKDQDLLIAWNELPYEPKPVSEPAYMPPFDAYNVVELFPKKYSDNDIPF